MGNAAHSRFLAVTSGNNGWLAWNRGLELTIVRYRRVSAGTEFGQYLRRRVVSSSFNYFATAWVGNSARAIFVELVAGLDGAFSFFIACRLNSALGRLNFVNLVERFNGSGALAIAISADVARHFGGVTTTRVRTTFADTMDVWGADTAVSSATHEGIEAESVHRRLFN